MELNEFLTSIMAPGCGILAILMTVIQISPIKVNPWSYLATKIGNAMNKDVLTKVDQLGSDLKNLRKVCDEREANSCRSRILHFNDEILHNVKHTKEHFDQTLIDISTYESYCTTHPDYKNNIANLAIKSIKHTYNRCCEENTFL